MYKIIKFNRFPTIVFEYDKTIKTLTTVTDKVFGDEYLRVNATFLWISGLILQIITTLTSAYSTFNVLIDRFFINKIKVNEKTKIIFFNTFRNSKIFLDNQSSPDSSTHACFYPEIDISNNLPNHLYIYDSLDDSLSQTLGEFPSFHD